MIIRDLFVYLFTENQSELISHNPTHERVARWVIREQHSPKGGLVL